MKVTVEVKPHHHLTGSGAQNRVHGLSTKKTMKGWLDSSGLGLFKLICHGVIGQKGKSKMCQCG